MNMSVFFCLAMQQVDDDVNAEVGMLAVSGALPMKKRPDKQARDYLPRSTGSGELSM